MLLLVLLAASASPSSKKRERQQQQQEASSRRGTRAPGGRSGTGPCDERMSLLLFLVVVVMEVERERVSLFRFRSLAPSFSLERRMRRAIEPIDGASKRATAESKQNKKTIKKHALVLPSFFLLSYQERPPSGSVRHAPCARRREEASREDRGDREKNRFFPFAFAVEKRRVTAVRL